MLVANRRFTALFHVTHIGETGRTLESRPFIGTVDEALDELREEFKEFFPDDYDRKDAKFWLDKRTELALGTYRSAQVIGRDMKGTVIIRVQQTSHYTEETQPEA